MSSLTYRLNTIEREVAEAVALKDIEDACQRLNWLREQLGGLYVDSIRASPAALRDPEAKALRRRIDEVNHVAFVAIGRFLIHLTEARMRKSPSHRGHGELLTLSRLGIPRERKAMAARAIGAARAEDGDG